MCILRVPNRFFGIRDLAYFKARSRDLGLKEKSEIRDCRYEWDKGFLNFTKRDSGNVALKN